MRTLASVFRATSLELLKSLSVGGNSGNTHFVRCIRGDLEYVPRGFKVCSGRWTLDTTFACVTKPQYVHTHTVRIVMAADKQRHASATAR